MRKNIRKERLQERIEVHRQKLESILSYLEKSHSDSEKYTISYLDQIILYPRAKDKVRFLLIDAISATGGNNLTRKGCGSKSIRQITSRLPNSEHVTIDQFYCAFHRSCDSLEKLYKHLTGPDKPIAGMSHKTCALFLRNLYLISRLVFKGETNFNETELQIPVDIVICVLLNKILECPEKDKLHPRHIILINKIFREELGDRFMLIEDLWFWGYFCLKGKGDSRKLGFNTDKYYSDLYLDHSAQQEKRFRYFVSKCTNLGIK